MSLKYLPICINIKDRKCLIVGGGTVALRKIETLMDYDIAMTVIAPVIDKKIMYYAERDLLKAVKREYKTGEAAEYGLVISASDNEAVNKTVADDCRSAKVPVNVVDNPALCDFIFPATFSRDCLTVSVSSNGRAPFLSGHIKLVLGEFFAEKRWTTIAQLASVYRNRVMKKYANDRKSKDEAYGRFLEADWQAVLKEVPDESLSDYLDTLLEPSEETKNNEQQDS